jgi:hypothetical protein
MGGIYLLMIIGTVIWILIDAPQRKLSRFWALGALLLWIVFFPIYLSLRGRVTKDGVQTFMWVAYGVMLVIFLIGIATLVSALGG